MTIPKKLHIAAIIALSLGCISVNATQNGQSNVSFNTSSIDNIKLEDIIQLRSDVSTTNVMQSENVKSVEESIIKASTAEDKDSSISDKAIPDETLLETYIENKQFSEALALFDSHKALKSFVAEVAEARGMALGVKDEIAQRMSTFDQKQVLLARIFDNLQIELQVTINALRAPNYDVTKAIIRELHFSSQEQCEVSKDWYNDLLSLVYKCGNKSNAYLINTDPENYTVERISSEQFGELKNGMEDIAQYF